MNTNRFDYLILSLFVVAAVGWAVIVLYFFPSSSVGELGILLPW